MSEITAEARDALEQAAAALLGTFLFEFSRLDMNLGLFVVWTDRGQHLDALTRQVADFSFHKKLDFLGQVMDRSLVEGSEGRKAYMSWLDQAHALRQRRNELVHGRWGVDLAREQVVNVVGLPTSSEQRAIRYSLGDLREILGDIQRLGREMEELRRRWPL